MKNVSKSFITISRQECDEVYKDILANADLKWNSASQLANVKDFSGAIGYSIISIEELVKALIIYFDSKGFSFRKVKGMDIFFRNHEIRYVIAYAIFVMAVFSDELKKFILRLRDDPEFIIRISAEMKEGDFFEKKLRLPVLRKLSELQKEFRWFAGIDLSRQDSFYSDYKESLKTPLNISAEDYNNFKKKLLKVREVGKGIIEAVEQNTPEVALQLTTLKRDFRQKNYYGLIEKGISRLRQSEDKPFIFIMSQFKE